MTQIINQLSLDKNGIYKSASVSFKITEYYGLKVTCPPKTDPIFKLGLGYNKKDIKGGKRYEQEAIYDGADYWFTSGDGCKNFTGQERRADMP
jgi:hypothetical protein